MDSNQGNISSVKVSLSSSGLAEKIKELRGLTGFGFTECKNALNEANNDFEVAKQILEEKNLEIAQKKVLRETKSGIISSYIHKIKNFPPKKGAIIDLRCETDYVAVRPEFNELAKSLCMEIVLQAPEYLCINDVPSHIWNDHLYQEMKNFQELSPELSNEVIKIKAEENTLKYFQSKSFLSLAYSRDEQLSIEQYIANHIALFRENIKVQAFKRFEI